MHKFVSNGLNCMVLQCRDHLNGYVQAPANSVLAGKHYNDPIPGITQEDLKDMHVRDRGVFSLLCAAISDKVPIDLYFDVHGSITFAGSFSGEEGWWFGFDTAHCYDTPERWPLEAVIKETKRLAKQIKEYLNAYDSN